MIKLYPHQKEFVAALRESFRTHQAVIGQAPTGSGKTVVGSFIAQSVVAKGKSAIFTVHRKNLIKQTISTFELFSIPYQLIVAGKQFQEGHNAYIASIETLRRRLDTVPAPDLLVVDEAHLSASRTWKEVIDHYKQHGTRILGLSATPCRADGKPLGDLYGEIVQGPNVRFLMDEKYLSDYVAYAPSTPDLSSVRNRAGDYAHGDLEEVMDRRVITGDAADHYQRLAPDTRAVAYCVSIKHSQHVCEYFTKQGIPAAHIDGKTPKAEQKEIIEGFADGKYKVLSNCDLITTGFDLSAQVGREVPIETIILLRATQSNALHYQMMGRGLRRKPKPAVILDHTGNLCRLGLPDDEIEWSLTGKSKKNRADPVKQCPKCFHVHNPAPVCPNCGHVYENENEGNPRKVEEVDGELERIDPKSARRHERAEERNAKTYQELYKLGKARGLTSPGGFASKRMLSRARNFHDLVELGQASGKKNPKAWANFMWKNVIPKIRGSRV